MLLTGKFIRSVDDKLRVAIPKRLRDAMSSSPTSDVYIAPGTDGSLAIYSPTAFAKLAQRMDSAPPTQEDVRAFNRLFYAQTECVEIDAQGRIRIPIELAQLAGLEKEAVMLGIQDHIELWDRARWEQYLAAKAPRYDQIAERAMGRPSGPATLG